MADIQTELTHNNVTYLSDRENYMKIFKNRLYDLIEIPDAIYDRTISDAPLNNDEILCNLVRRKSKNGNTLSLTFPTTKVA